MAKIVPAQIRHFTGGLGTLEAVLPTIDHLLSAYARWRSGQSVFVNGGFARAELRAARRPAP